MKIPAPNSAALRLRAQTLESQLPEHRAGELLVRLKPASGFAESPLDQLGAEVLHRFDFPGQRLVEQGEMLHLKLPAGVTTAEGMLALQDDPRVVYATPNHVFEAPDALAGKPTNPNDMDPKQWALPAIHAPEAWSVSHGSKTGPIIAVFDSGVDTEHPDLKANLWVNRGEIPGNGIDDDGNGYVDDVHGIYPKQGTGDIQDTLGHGTHTAGTIGAVGNNNLGVTGINWDAQIMVIKAFDEKGKTDAAWVAKGMEYAAKNGARITSNSWGGNVFNPAMLDAFESCSALHICAAGNRKTNNDVKPEFPASFELDNIISVANSDRNDRRANSSNFGLNTVDLAAPGTDILSTKPGGSYQVLSGTSMAAPHVSGVAGLIATVYPQASNEEIKNRLLYSTDKVEALKGLVSTGGRLYAAGALEKDAVGPQAVAQMVAKKVDSRGLTLSWKAPGDDGAQGTAALYELRYSDQPITADNFARAQRYAVDAPKPGGSQEEVRVDMRPDGQARKLYFAVKTYDNVGNSSPLSTMAATVPAATVVFRDQGPASFVAEGSWAQTDLPDVGKVWTDSPAGDYAEGQSLSLATRPFSLKGIKNASVVFDAKTDLDGTDRVWLQASSDGQNWSPLGSLTGSHPWEPHQVDLSSFAGEKSVRFRFSLLSDGHGNADGVYLKNISIMGDA